MNRTRRRLYPREWERLARTCKEVAGWRCAHYGIRHGAWRRSKRTGQRYRVWMHAAHKYLCDTHNPCPVLLCLCPTCHGRRDYWQRWGPGTRPWSAGNIDACWYGITARRTQPEWKKARSCMRKKHRPTPPRYVSSTPVTLITQTQLSEMAQEEGRLWIEGLRARLVTKQQRERAYLDRCAAHGMHTPTDYAYEADQVLERELLVLLDDLIQGLATP